jgi:hypothetical protein
VYGHIGIAAGFGKTNQRARANQSNLILDWCNRHDVVPSPHLTADIRDGFGDSATGEDAFDAFIGALGMIEAVRNPARFRAPTDPAVLSVEGWILGMDSNVPARSAFIKQNADEIRPGVPIRKAEFASTKPAGVTSASGSSRLCPACKTKVFSRWPFGWDAHASHTCLGIEGDTPEERKRAYRNLYL